MTKIYHKFPSNFKEIKDYITHDKKKVIDFYFDGDKYFFYDTCSILHHSNSSKREYIIKYLKKKDATIIITRTVLMELTSNYFQIHPIQINFIKELYQSGLKVLLFDEEFIIDCLKEMLNITNEEANLLLGYAIKEVNKSKGIIREIVDSMEKSFRSKILGNNPGNVPLYDEFFQYARSKKKQGDSLAEKLMFICIIVLTRIPLGKYILLSDDLRIRSNVISINKYLKDKHKVKEPFQLTTPALIYRMYKDSIITLRDDMLDILSSSFSGNVNVFYVGEYDIEQEYHSFNKEELIDCLINEKEFRIMY
ncbi:MAG: transposase [Firmicutes bacterium]|nr:transposase [Bacillota bacterium]